MYIMRETMTKTSKTNHFQKFIQCQGGFSLIELAIVMIIIGLLTTPLLGIYKNHQEQEKIDNTDITISAVTSALGEYYMQFGYYPCPADNTLPFGDTNAGVSDCTQLQGLGVNTCKAGNGFCRVTGNPGAVYIGGVPYKTLNILYSDVIDGYKNPLTYTVSAEYTDTTKAFDEARVGSITLTRESRDAAGNIQSTVTPNVFYLLTSHGEDGAGSFSVLGQQSVPCTSGHLDSENCDIDANYLDRLSLRSYGNNSQYYDDRVEAVAYAPKNLWNYSNNTPGAVYNTNAGAIGIGTKTPDTTVKLDVNGAVKADNFRGNMYCDASGNNCFQTNSIAGTGMNCSSGYMVGVANNQAQCADIKINVTPKTCGPNEYVSGIDSGGNVQCATLP